MRFASRRLAFAFASAAAAAACSSGSGEGHSAAALAAATSLDQLAIACSDSLDAVYQAPTGLPDITDDSRGDVVHCAADRILSASAIDAAARVVGYSGPAFVSGARVYRVAYRTERVSTSAGTPLSGYSSALVLLPDTPIAALHPLIVAAHGSVGVAAACAPSLGSLTGSGDYLDDARSLVLPLVGYGYTVIMPDYAGFGFGGTSGWLLSEDEAHSLLDATRAAAKLLAPGTLSGEVAIVGHSQGGHAALSAQALASSYGLSGHLSGVVAEAPLWLPARTWGSALTDVFGLRPDVSAGALTYAVQYFYTHGEVEGGPGHGTDMFLADKQDALRAALTSTCLDTLGDQVAALGQHPSDLFASGFALGVSTCADTGICLGSDASTWEGRWHDDRPPIDPAGAAVAILNGGNDATVTPAYAACGIDKIDADFAAAGGGTTELELCFDPGAVHGGEAVPGGHPELGITRRNAAWINDWLAANTLGGPAPDACAPWTATAADGSAITCPSLPPNTDF